MKLPSKVSQGTESSTKNSLQNQGGNAEEFPVKCNLDIGAQLVGDVKSDGKVPQKNEGGTSRMGSSVGEEVVGQGSRGSKGTDEVELSTKARGSLFTSSKQGGGVDYGAVAVKREGEVGRDEWRPAPHGIQEIGDFGRWSPRWRRREDFDIGAVEEFSRGFHNLGI